MAPRLAVKRPRYWLARRLAMEPPRSPWRLSGRQSAKSASPAGKPSKGMRRPAPTQESASREPRHDRLDESAHERSSTCDRLEDVLMGEQRTRHPRREVTEN